jgi:hypothetical protein
MMAIRPSVKVQIIEEEASVFRIVVTVFENFCAPPGVLTLFVEKSPAKEKNPERRISVLDLIDFHPVCGKNNRIVC